MPAIALLTDFGLDDGYVGVMQGVILGINPSVAIVDLGHQIRPQDVAQAAFVLATSYRYFAPATIFVAVVDPGVGSERRAIALRTPRGTFVGPDNGLFWPVAAELGAELSAESGRGSLVGTEVAGVVLTNPEYFLPRVSSTFHGRDVFAPVAAHLSLGVPLERLGPEILDLVALPIPLVERRPGELVGQVVYRDHFGNLITNLTADDLARFRRPVVLIAGHEIQAMSKNYQGSGNGSAELLALLDSADRLEIAIANGDAARVLGSRPGEPVTIRESAVD